MIEEIVQLKKDHPMRIAIDGITASGKTTLAKKLVSDLQAAGHKAIRVTLDGFHNPRSVRYERGRTSPEGYYFDAYNYEAVVENLLRPLGPNGSHQIRTQVWNLEQDIEDQSEFFEVSKDTFVIVDGSFSLRKELFDSWDFSIYLKVDFETAQKRAGERDKDLFGSREKAIETTKNRYHRAHEIHNELEKPWEKADLVISN